MISPSLKKRTSITQYMGSVFVYLFFGSVFFTFFMGATFTSIQISKSVAFIKDRASQVLILNENELLNELALQDEKSIRQHLNLLKNQLSANSICMFTSINHKLDFNPESSDSCNNDKISYIDKISSTKISLANQFKDFNLRIVINLRTMLINTVVKPVASSAFLVFLISILPLALGYYIIFRILRQQILKPLVNVTNHLSGDMSNSCNSNLEKVSILEISSLYDAVKIFQGLITKSIMIDVASQVSHDIRSPLSALNMMLIDLKELPEQKRVIVRSALQRINDISNSLLEKCKTPPAGSIPAQSAPSPLAIPPAGAREVVLLSSMVGELLSEKRIQFREKMGVSIEEDLTKAYGYFASVNATELKRVLSNLINNSIEAFPEGKGRVTVGIRGYKDVVQIIVSDNGKGIPASVLAKLGERGVSHGKESLGTSGSGLGVYHAKSTVEAYGGKFEIQSREGQGTMIQIQLPRSVAPDWFVEELRLKPDMSVFSVDDDQSIHGIWSERLEAMKVDKQRISLKSYTSAKAFVDICEGLAPEVRANALFLVDYEFLNQGVNGLQVIERLGIASRAILVTSRYDEVDIQKKCQGMGVKLIPKALAGYVPIVVD